MMRRRSRALGAIPRIEGFSYCPRSEETKGIRRVIRAMSRNSRPLAVRLLLVSLPMWVVGASASAGSTTDQSELDPMRFFEGRTESVSMVKVIMRKPYRSRTIGDGTIAEGVLHLVQKVHQEGKAPYDRRWRMRQVAPGRFSGTMSEATGPILAEKVGQRYRFRFKMKGNLAVEQWLTPLPGGKAAKSVMSIRKLGIVVGRSEGTIRRS